MKSSNSLLISLGILMTSVALAQQPPPPPPPPPAAASQPSSQDVSSQTNQQQQNQNTVQQNQSPVQQNPNPVQQNQNPVQQTPAQPGQVQQSPTQPAPVQQSPAQPIQAQQSPAQQTPATQPATQTTVPQNTGQPQQNPANPTEPTVPSTERRSAGDESVDLPQADKAELARIEAEMDRIEARRADIELRKKDNDRLRESRAVMKEVLSGKVKAVNALIPQSKCVIVIPAVKKGAVGFGVKYGRGVMTCRLGENFNGPWSAPAMYALEGGNFGLQIGLQGTDLVLLVMNERGVDSLLGSKAKLGGDASLAAGPIGRTYEASTDLAMRAKILAFSRSHGIFAGVALDGSTLRPDNHANEVLYGRSLSARAIVRSGEVAVPRAATPLLQLLQGTTRASTENETNSGQGQPR